MLISLVALARDARLQPRAPTLATQLINARPIWLLRCSIRLILVVRRQSPSHGLTTPVDRFRDATR